MRIAGLEDTVVLQCAIQLPHDVLAVLLFLFCVFVCFLF